MSRCFAAWLLGLITVATAEEIPRAVQITEPPAAAVPDAIISRTQQFRVSGGDSLSRGAAALLAEETKDELLRLTGEQDAWKMPVSIRLHGKPGDPLPVRTVAMRLNVIEGVPELRLDVHLSRGIEHEQERFKRTITAALLYGRSLRPDAEGAPEHDLSVPPWLSDGLREASAWRLNQSDHRLYEALFKRGGLFKLDGLFTVDENEFESLDGASRAAFRVSSGTLVMALLEQPQGREGFRSFLTEVASYQGEMPGLLRKHFPELNLSETSLSKWCELQLAAKGGRKLLTDILTIQQSETALAEALRLDFRTAEGIVLQKELASWPELAALAEPERIAAVRQPQDALVRLSYRCFPSYRPLLADYQQMLESIAKNKTRDVAQRLAALDETRVTMVARAARAKDYLDWFEITRARETSGAFDDYQRLKERLKANPHQRKDELSAYLDRMDRIFHREQPKTPALPPP
ncbi:MAG: hypothetical protein Q8Q59_02905 [Luteolibacter sp.]|jgi:hypothetical protein|nr:hypothetical protein [Luteolibacter sp.]